MHGFCNATWRVNLNLVAGQWGGGPVVAFRHWKRFRARRKREVVSRSHPSAWRTPGPIAPRGARTQNAFSDDPKDHSPCAPAQNSAGSAISPLHLCYPRSGTRPLVIGPRHRGLPEGIVETLIQNSDEANLALFSSGLTTGQSVRILSGPFANFVGQLERLDAAGRVRVLLDMMGTTVPVAVRRGAICPAAA